MCVKGDACAPCLKFGQYSPPVGVSLIPFPSTGGGAELEPGVKEEVMSKLRITQYSLQVQLFQGILVDWGIANRDVGRAWVNGDNDTRGR
jgi:hypothetical protein